MLPFINQAFHWDDRDFVADAQVLARNPLQFHQINYSYGGRFFAKFPFHHPPLLAMYLSLIIRLAGRISKILFHLGYIVFPLIAVISMYALARRFTRIPLIAALLLAFSPGFLIMAHTVMGNVPGIAFWLAGMAFFVWGVDYNRWMWLLTGGLLMGVTFLTVAQAVSLVPIAFAYALIRRRLGLRIFISLTVPLIIYFAWRYYIEARYGHAPGISYNVMFNRSISFRSILAYLGETIIFAPALIAVFAHKKYDLLAAFIALPPLVTWAVISRIGAGGLTLSQGLQLAVLVSAAFLLLYQLVSRGTADLINWFAKRPVRGDRLFLLIWVMGVLAIYLGSSITYVSTRHILPLFAPVILLFVMEAEQMWPMRPRLRTAFIAAALALTLALALGGAIADFRLANSERATAAELGRRLAKAPGKHWVLDEFDFRYYMEKQGFTYLSGHSVARSGDIVVSSKIDAKGVVGTLPAGYHTVLWRQQVNDSYPVRTMNIWAGGGFYGDPMGPLPIAFSTSKLDEITVSQLKW
ncbi:MAG: glycosyltransferase family 39 protein [Actinomycetota bacterium]|nr:glycosyltransferase family 39 protein [Actinomycetota bacterium]